MSGKMTRAERVRSIMRCRLRIDECPYCLVIHIGQPCPFGEPEITDAELDDARQLESIAYDLEDL